MPLVGDGAHPVSDSQVQGTAAQSADDDSRIDVMVLYTSGLASDHPGSEIDTRIQILIDKANLILSDSNVNMQLNLLHSEEIIYSDDSPGGMS